MGTARTARDHKGCEDSTSQVRERPTWAEEWAHSVGREPRSTSKKMRAAGRQTPHVITGL